MNILHMKYAYEVARAGSPAKAAETLLIAQPNISRSIKEPEADIGITIFNRSAKGMALTPEGGGVHRLCRGNTPPKSATPTPKFTKMCSSTERAIG